jgi:hypothetical protein
MSTSFLVTWMIINVLLIVCPLINWSRLFSSIKQRK